MRQRVFITIVLISLSGCSDIRTESSDVAHVDYVNRVYYVAQQSAKSAGCYDFEEASTERETCLNKEIDNSIHARSKSQFNNSMKIVNQLEDEGKLAKTDDGMSWYFITDIKPD
jgi:hypothetical protein